MAQTTDCRYCGYNIDVEVALHNTGKPYVCDNCAIEQMERCREQQIIETLATKVMGWEPESDFVYREGVLNARCALGHFTEWNPLQDIADAWMLVEKIQETRYIKIQVGKTVLCLSGKYQGSEDLAEGAETAPRAISNLALKIFA